MISLRSPQMWLSSTTQLRELAAYWKQHLLNHQYLSRALSDCAEIW